jgi:GWxTD domain-containing protein
MRQSRITPGRPRVAAPAVGQLARRGSRLAGLLLGGLAAVGALGACAGNRQVGQARPGTPAGTAVAAAPEAEMQRLYRGMGLVAGTGAIPFVSSVSFLRSPRPDSTLVLVALSLPPRVLAFTREGDRYAAIYSVRMEVRRGAAIVRETDAKETVRVPTFRETSRTDESIIWQQYLRLAPGRYTMLLAVKDESGIRSASEEVAIEVPMLAPGTLGSPIAVYQAIPRTSIDSIPRLLARPRSTVTFGVDSILPVYVEAVGAEAPERVNTRLIGEGDQTLWESTVELAQRGDTRSTTLAVPVARMGVGLTTLAVVAPGRTDTVRTRILVSLGDDVPIASFSEMLGYLRYFSTPERLKTLRDATPANRAEAWAQFLKGTDPLPGTAEHEGLRDYFQRIRAANQRFRDDGQAGWLSDRGVAFVGLGDPDNIYDTGLNDPTARVRQQVWEYREWRLQLVFLDQGGFGRWRLSPSGMNDLQNAIRRRLATLP